MTLLCNTKRYVGPGVGITPFLNLSLGRKFVLRTDHSALQWLHSFKEPEGQVARWQLEGMAGGDG